MATSEGNVLISGEKTVAAAGIAEALFGSEKRVKSVLLRAKAANTNQVYIGGPDVASATNDGLDASESITLTADAWLDLANIFIDVDTNGEGVDFYGIKG